MIAFSALLASPVQTLTPHIRRLRIGEGDSWSDPTTLNPWLFASIFSQLPVLEKVKVEHMRWVYDPSTAVLRNGRSLTELALYAVVFATPANSAVPGGPGQSFIDFLGLFAEVGNLVLSYPYFGDNVDKLSLYRDDAELTNAVVVLSLPRRMQVRGLEINDVPLPFLRILEQSPENLTGLRSLSIRSYNISDYTAHQAVDALMESSIGHNLTDIMVQLDPSRQPTKKTDVFPFLHDFSRFPRLRKVSLKLGTSGGFWDGDKMRYLINTLPTIPSPVKHIAITLGIGFKPISETTIGLNFNAEMSPKWRQIDGLLARKSELESVSLTIALAILRKYKDRLDDDTKSVGESLVKAHLPRLIARRILSIRIVIYLTSRFDAIPMMPLRRERYQAFDDEALDHQDTAYDNERLEPDELHVSGTSD
ncbi:hypothetical protein EUX98_g2524 [Antrodiella citrinella]|uniref:Uncharacterized protein n=1 Tax=Antrodiella citrinella TaxID=2447956 RepID=A0A4S4N036_9APHY|nr:hypothetical protein EUX98_g2524 [Antrodiella citrinella]